MLRRRQPPDAHPLSAYFETRYPATETHQEFWIDARRLPKGTASTFYRNLVSTRPTAV